MGADPLAPQQSIHFAVLLAVGIRALKRFVTTKSGGLLLVQGFVEEGFSLVLIVQLDPDGVGLRNALRNDGRCVGPVLLLVIQVYWSYRICAITEVAPALSPKIVTIFWVSAKPRDVLVDPFNAHALVYEAVIPGVRAQPQGFVEIQSR